MVDRLELLPVQDTSFDELQLEDKEEEDGDHSTCQAMRAHVDKAWLVL